MKKLLATSALVGAAALFATSANAAPSVSVGGQIDFQAGFTDQDSSYETGANSRDAKFRNDTEIHVSAEGKTDSGLTYGAVIELEADVNDDDDSEGENADKTYVYVEGSFGRVEMGANTDAAEASRVSAASIARATGGIDGDYKHFVNIAGVTGTFIDGSGLPTANSPTAADGLAADANKLTYYSPRVSGVQLGVSYTPDQGDTGTATGFTGEANGDQESVWNVGLNYSGQFNEAAVNASATYETGESENAAVEDLSAYAVGASVAYRGLSVAGSYADFDDSGMAVGSNKDAGYWTVGAAYEQGPAGISVTYIDGEYADNDATNLVVGADYQLAPGLVPYAEVSFFDFDPIATGAVSNDGTVVLLGTELTF